MNDGENSALAHTPPEAQDVAVQSAIRLWADGNTRTETYDRKDKLADKVSILRNFFQFVGKHPSEVTPLDVERWRDYMEGRELSHATVYARISRVSSFYRWLMQNPDLKFHAGTNPAQHARPRHPLAYQSESVKALTDVEMNRLLEHTQQLAASGNIVAKRDYALLLFYFLTGLRRNEVISLKGKDIVFEDERLVINYRRKGGMYSGREVSERAVREALLDYLRASNRLDVLDTPRPLWTRHDRAGRPGAALISRSFVDNLKKYALQVGIKHIHLHQTRHTYARIIAEETGSLLDTQEALDHENAATTRVYVQRITVKRDKHARNIAKRMTVLSSGGAAAAADESPRDAGEADKAS